YLYTGDTGSNSVGVYSLADPLHPVQLQEVFLGGPTGTPRQTGVFQVAVDPSGRFVYAINQNTSPDGSFQQGNQLHILAVASDGTLSEPTGPTLFAPGDVPGTAHPQGIAVVTRVERGPGQDHDRDRDGRKRFDAKESDAARADAFFRSAGRALLDLGAGDDRLLRQGP